MDNPADKAAAEGQKAPKKKGFSWATSHLSSHSDNPNSPDDSQTNLAVDTKRDHEHGTDSHSSAQEKAKKKEKSILRLWEGDRYMQRDYGMYIYILTHLHMYTYIIHYFLSFLIYLLYVL